MIGWKIIKFGEIATFRNGLNYNRASHGIGCKIIGVPDFGDKLIPNYNSIGEINPDGIIKADDYLEFGDILFVRSNGNKNLVGRSLFINEINHPMVFSGFCIRARINSLNAHPLFFAYFFRTTLFRKIISASAGGANIQNLNQGLLSKAKVPLPSIDTQRRIASILSAYDDLIENNLRRIKLLEELAQRTYEEWFVKFTINGEKLPLNEETGLPEGWGFIKVGAVLDKTNTTKKIKKTEYLETGAIPVIDQSRDFIAGYTNDSEAQIETGKPIIVFGDHTRVLKFINFPFARGADGTQVIISKEKRMTPHLFYFTLRGIDLSNYHYARHFKFLKDSEMVLPDGDSVREFEIFASKNFEKIKNLQNQNRLLKESRDILLPRLMSGVINMEEAEEQLAVAAESEVKYEKK